MILPCCLVSAEAKQRELIGMISDPRMQRPLKIERSCKQLVLASVEMRVADGAAIFDRN